MAQALESKWRVIAVAFPTALTAAATAAAYLGRSALLDQRDDGSFLLWEHPEVVAHGRLLYAHHCAACHGANGEGQHQLPEGTTASTPLAPPHDAGGHTWLTDPEIVAVLSYIKSLWPADIRAQQDSLNRLYAAENAAVRRLLKRDLA
jgi:mono/diheme cytochrome c family protein